MLDIKDRITGEADPVGFLIKLARGEGFRAATSANSPDTEIVYPTLDQRIKAQLVLEKRLFEKEGKADEEPEQNMQAEIDRLREKLADDLARLINEITSKRN